jgi:hypothetical protein
LTEYHASRRNATPVFLRTFKYRLESSKRKDLFDFFFFWRHGASRMTDQNLNFWGELVVPVGVGICFGVALLVWLRDELRAEPEDDGTKKPER